MPCCRPRWTHRLPTVDDNAQRTMTPRRVRLDAELVRRGLARSREHASELIAQSRVRVAGTVATKPATAVSTDVALVVAEVADRPDFVSRGAHKLTAALDAFGPGGLRIEGRNALDAGASTGGFTDVLLRRGAAGVTAVDVGYGQLAWQLRIDPRVTVLDRMNVRELRIEDLPARPEIVVADLSFISLILVLPGLSRVAVPDAHLVVLVKPQFEVGRDRLGKRGVVRDPGLRESAVVSVARSAESLHLGVCGMCASPLPGPAGNVEYFLWLAADAPPIDPAAARTMVSRGPQ